MHKAKLVALFNVSSDVMIYDGMLVYEDYFINLSTLVKGRCNPHITFMDTVYEVINNLLCLKIGDKLIRMGVMETRYCNIHDDGVSFMCEGKHQWYDKQTKVFTSFQDSVYYHKTNLTIRLIKGCGFTINDGDVVECEDVYGVGGHHKHPDGVGGHHKHPDSGTTFIYYLHDEKINVIGWSHAKGVITIHKTLCKGEDGDVCSVTKGNLLISTVDKELYIYSGDKEINLNGARGILSNGHVCSMTESTMTIHDHNFRKLVVMTDLPQKGSVNIVNDNIVISTVGHTFVYRFDPVLIR